MPVTTGARALALLGPLAFTGCTRVECDGPPPDSSRVAVTQFHGDAAKRGAYAGVTRAEVMDPEFGLLWRSAPLHHAEIDGVDYPPLIYASPLFVPAVEIETDNRRGAVDLAITATSNGWVYAVATGADSACGLLPGAFVWSVQLTRPMPVPNLDQGVPMGVLSTPVVDLDATPPALYVASHDDEAGWQAFGLELASGRVLPGWPVTIDDDTLAPVNKNGPARFHDSWTMSQRGSLALSPAGDRLYVAFGTYWGTGVGWIVAVDTVEVSLAAALSAAPWTPTSSNGGMWGSAGPAVGDDGRVWVTTGNSPGDSGDTANVWGSSLLVLSPELDLERVYSPFNYCVLDSANMDLAASQPTLLDALDSAQSPNTVAFGGKQGVVYLLDRDTIAPAGDSRGPCSDDAASDRSLLPPDPQPQFGTRGPLSVFGPYSDIHGQVEHAKMRTKLASWADRDGRRVLFASGSTKAAPDSSVNVPPSVAKLHVVTGDGAPYLELEATNDEIIMHNPGSPMVSGGADGGVVWVLDRNAPRLAGLLDPETPRPILYAFDAEDLALLWTSGPLRAGGKYASPIVAGDVLLVGTDRLEAYGVPGD